jgi:hypothetical protein
VKHFGSQNAPPGKRWNKEATPSFLLKSAQMEDRKGDRCGTEFGSVYLIEKKVDRRMTVLRQVQEV